jgi:antitoxin component of RelBE/YafQ-DinJ toxin-antitoxin module
MIKGGPCEQNCYDHRPAGPTSLAERRGGIKTLGLTTNQTVNLFFAQVSLNQGIPFDVHIPNAATAKAIEAGLAGRGLQSAIDMDGLIAQLEA